MTDRPECIATKTAPHARGGPLGWLPTVCVALAMLGILVLPMTPSVAQDDANLALTLRLLQRQLTGPTLAGRQAAEDEMIRLGPSILPLLPVDRETMDPALRAALTRIRHNLQTQRVATAAEATSVSLREVDAPVAGILDSISRQSDIPIVWRDRPPGTDAEPKVSITIEDASFWQSLDAVLDAAKLTVAPDGQAGAVTVERAAEDSPSRREGTSYVGPFRIHVERVTASRGLSGPTDGLLRVVVNIAWRPDASPIFLRQAMKTISAVDDLGGTFTAADPVMSLEIPTDARLTDATITLPLQLPPEQAKRLTIRGSLSAAMPGKTETFKFGDLTVTGPIAVENARQRIAGVTVCVEQVRRAIDGWEIRIRTRYDDPGSALDSYRRWVGENKASLRLPDGTTLAPSDETTTRQSANEIGVVYKFKTDRTLTGCQFLYQTPGSIITRDYAYTLKDVPLP